MGKFLVCLSLFGILVVGCGGTPSSGPTNPTVSISAVQTQAAGAVFATQTASAPTRTKSPNATSTPNATNTPNPTDTPQATAIPKPTSVPITLKGKGQSASDTFLLNPGLAIFDVTHDGRANIIVELLNDQGASVDLITNDIGAYAGRKAVEIPTAGSYLLDVNADGNWSIEIEQPEPTANEPASPLAFKGCGQKVIPFMLLNKGLVRFALTHEGKENFIVSLLAANGDHAALLANEVGKFDGSTAEGISEAGVYLLDVAADGNWMISITQGEQKADLSAAIDVGACAQTGNASAPAPTQVSANAPAKPTLPPKPKATPTPDLPPVAQDQTVRINEQWDSTLISVRRDKVLFGAFDRAETAFGTYATVLLRVKNNATGSDHVGRTLSFAVSPDGGAPIYYKLFNTLEDKAQYYYACCDTAFSTVPPGAEAVILMVFDVPETTKELRFYFTPSNPFEKDMPRIGPEFIVPNFDQIPPRGVKP